MAFDLKIDPVTNDIVIDADGNLETIEGSEEVAQHIWTSLDAPRGTDPIDPEFGLPYLELIFVKDPNLSAISDVILSVIVDRSDIIELSFFEMVFNPRARTLDVEFEVVTTEGLASGQAVIGGL